MNEQLLVYIAVVMTIELSITMFYTIKYFFNKKDDDNQYQ